MSINKSSLKLAGFYALMFIIIISICIAVTEYGIAYYYKKNYLASQFDPVLGWRTVEGSYSVKPMNTYRVYDYYINELGLRNRDIEKAKHNDTKRIIFLGDSFTYGFAMKNEDLFTTQTEKLLNKTGAIKYETINAGVPKYGTAQELLLMKDLANNGIKGDIYVLMVFTNDILDNLQLGNYRDLSIDHRQPGFILNSDGELVLKYPPSETPHSAPKTTTQVSKKVQAASSKAPVKQTSQNAKPNRSINLSTIKFLKERVGTFLQTRPALIKSLVNLGFDIELPRMPSLISGWYQDKIIERGVPLMKALIKEMKKEAQSHNAELFVVLIPSPIQVNRKSYVHILKNSLPDNKAVTQWINEPARPQVIMEQICKDLDIRFLDLLPIMIENKEMNLYIPGDGHFSKAGHDVTAKSLTKFLKSKKHNQI